MLGQHPQTYGFPELNLFVADEVRRMLVAYQRAGEQAQHGLLRTLAQLHEGEQTVESIDRAQEWLKSHTHWSTKALFDHLLESVSPRVGIDKSPRTVMKEEYLERMFRCYPDARYLHLVRHPRATAESQIKITSRNSEWGGRLDASRIKPDRWWERSQKAILSVVRRMSPTQVMLIQGENLLSEPKLYLAQIMDWLGLRTDDEAIRSMLHPENSPYACIGPENAKYGNDINFLERPEYRGGSVVRSSLEGSVSWDPTRGMSEEIKCIARLYGYR